MQFGVRTLLHHISGDLKWRMEVFSSPSYFIKFPLFFFLSVTLLQVTEKVVVSHRTIGLSPLECPRAITTGDCLDAIYHRYGSSGTIRFDQFKVFLGSIGLGGVGVVDDHDDEEHEDHTHSYENDEEDHSSHLEDTTFGDNHTTDAHIQKCLSPKSLLAAVDLEMTDSLNVSQFLQLCPILLQQLDVHACAHSEEDTEDHHHEMPSEDHPTTQERHRREVWGFAIAAITVISLASITCILTVPCIQHYPVAFQRLLAFLIALAIGTLSGDAIMHLIPHSFIPHSHDLHGEAGSSEEGSHENHYEHESSSSTSTEHLVILKGLAVLGGIFAFFLFEQLLQYYSDKASIRRKKDYTGLPTNHNRIGSKLSGHAATENTESVPMVCSAEEIAEKTPQKVSPSAVLPSSSISFSQSTSKESFPYSGLNNPREECKSHSDDAECAERTVSPSESHHHHGHSHVMLEGSGIASLAWVVVLGDAMHNFCDGLVVGSAFVDSLAGGISTSIAIMCHEIPHELGDFAVMLKAGMSIKQALAFQAVSSVLAYIGMAVGVAVGNISSAATWMFALAAGMFLYIALVDLIPEMVDSTKSCKDNQILHLVLQTAGVVLGCSIMLVIALNEDRLLELLGG